MLNARTVSDMEALAEGYYTSTLPQARCRPIRTFLPEGYQRNYAYPLLVLFHGTGSNEADVLRLMPKISRRNFIAVSIRGSQTIGARGDGGEACTWNDTTTTNEHIATLVSDTVALLRLSYSINTKLIYTMGINDGTSAAYRAAFTLGSQIAGVIALNGSLPRSQGKTPLFQLDQIRRQRILMCQSSTASTHDVLDVMRDRKLFYAAGAEATFHRFKSSAALPTEMFRRANRWIIEQINAIPLEVPVTV